MELRNGSLVGGSPGQLALEARPMFEGGVRLILQRWTALTLAVENEWGGRESKQRADEMYEDILAWFYDNREHYADDLEVDLEEIMGADFNADLEDESPREVSRELVALHNDLIRGDTTRLARLQQLIAEFQGASMSKRQRRDNDGTLVDDDESSPDEDEDEKMADLSLQPDIPHQAKQEPVIDDEGFQLVQRRNTKR